MPLPGRRDWPLMLLAAAGTATAFVAMWLVFPMTWKPHQRLPGDDGYIRNTSMLLWFLLLAFTASFSSWAIAAAYSPSALRVAQCCAITTAAIPCTPCVMAVLWRLFGVE